MNGLTHVPKKLLTRSDKKWYPFYIDHAKIVQKDYGINSINENGNIVDIPIGLCSSILMGPGTSITHGAISICADCNCLIEWVGENSSIYYATGISPVSSNKNAMNQIKIRCNRKLRLEIVKKLFKIRYKDLDVNSLTIKNMMGIEGHKVRTTYSNLSKTYGVVWRGRKYTHSNYKTSDDINKGISFANSILYSFCKNIIISNGYLPSIGFIHCSSMIDFVLDLADVFKEKYALEVAFESMMRCKTFNMEDLRHRSILKYESDKASKQINNCLHILFEEKS